ncbi:hypothetical protein [Janthinobacterium sp. PSPC2-1]|uniref:hypothetical protein n=1 Tax=unclassified Janthinobacterium TaxID=2610881 RepID=UPI003CF56C7E
MDYSEMLFAFHVRELAAQRLVIAAREAGIDHNEFIKNPGIEQYVQGVVTELRAISEMIRETP